jgi:hypothetical protein
MVHMTVAFAPGETERMITGYAAARPMIRALDGTADRVTYNTTTGLFTIAVKPGAGAQASLQIRPRRGPLAGPAAR